MHIVRLVYLRNVFTNQTYDECLSILVKYFCGKKPFKKLSRNVMHSLKMNEQRSYNYAGEQVQSISLSEEPGNSVIASF